MSNEVYCDECFRAKWPGGHEEKTCTHGLSAGVECVVCGKVRAAWSEKPYWHCLGTAPGTPPTP